MIIQFLDWFLEFTGFQEGSHEKAFRLLDLNLKNP